MPNHRIAALAVALRANGIAVSWPGDACTLMTSYATLVEEMTGVAPLAVDSVPWVVDSHREAVSHVVRQYDSLTASNSTFGDDGEAVPP